MIPEPAAPSPRTVRRTATGDRAAVLVLSIALVIVFSTQREITGFEPGHHGWVSSHGLAIASKATPSAGFLGYSARVEDRAGKTRLVYFDRYPVFFSAFSNQVLALGGPDVSHQVARARQLMNAVLAATMLAVYVLARFIAFDPWQAVAATLLAFSGTYFLSYKDMFHFDQPALLGMVLLWIGIASYERDRRRALLYPLAAAAVSLGRGYASLAVLIAWLATQTAAALATARRAGSRAGARELAGMESLRVLLVCAGLAALFLGYNVLLESRRSGLPLGETSILSSASRRLGFDRDFDLQFSRELAWRGVVATQLERYLIASTPAVLGIRVDPGVNGPRARLDDRSALFALSLLVLAALALVVPRRRGPVPDDGGRARSATRLQRRMLAVLALTGPIWLLSIRRLAQFHDYTAMYYLGTLLAVDLLILGRLPRRAVQLAAAVALALFVAGNFDVQRRDPERAERANAETREMERIASVLPGDARVYVDGDWRSLIEGAPLALGFYLADATLVEDVRRADYALSRRKVAAGGLTPENRHIFAYATRQRSQP